MSTLSRQADDDSIHSHTHKHHTHTHKTTLYIQKYERCAILLPASVSNWTTAGYTMFTRSCLLVKPCGVARNHVTGAESNTCNCPKDSHQLNLKGPDLLQCVQRSVVGFLHLCIHAAPKPLLVLCKCFFHVCTHTQHIGPVVSVTHTHSTLGQWCQSHTHSALGQSHTHSTLGQWCQSHTHTRSALGQWCQSHTHSALGQPHTHSTLGQWCQSHTHSALGQWCQSYTYSALGQWCQSHTYSALGQWCQSHTHSALDQWCQSHTHTQCTGPVVSVIPTHSALGQWCQSHMSVTSILFWGSLLVSVTHTHSHRSEQIIFKLFAVCKPLRTYLTISGQVRQDLPHNVSSDYTGPTSQCEFRLDRTYLTM